MPYFSTTYTSHCFGRLSRQAHSYHVQDSSSSAQSPRKEVLQQDSKYVTASLGRSNRISHCLFPLISKFEALDALSQGIKEPSLRPAPLQISRNSSPRRGGFDGPASMKLEAIFSPSRSRSRHEPLLLENFVASPAEDMFTASTIKRSGSGRLKQTQSSQRVNSIRLREGTQQSNLATIKESRFGTSLQCQNADSNQAMKETRENSIVRDRIRFFDGCMEHTTTSGPCTYLYDSNPGHSSPLFKANTYTRSSLHHGIAPTTPPYHKPNCPNRSVSKPSSGPSTTGGVSTHKTICTKSGIPHTPTKSGPRYGTRTHRPFEQHVPNPFLQTPHMNPPTRQVSPKTPLTGPKSNKSDLIGRPLYKLSKVPDPIKKDASPEEKRGRNREQQPPAKRTNPTSLDRRTSGQLQVSHSDDTPMAKIGSKDKDMKTLRERGVVAKTFQSGPWSLSKATGTRIPRPKGRDFPNATSSVLPPCVPQSNTTKPRVFPQKPASKIEQMDGTRIPTLVQRNYVGTLTPVKATCRGIHGKIKQWESKVDVGEIFLDDRNNYCSSKIINNSTTLRKSIFENPWTDDVGKELEKRGLDGHEIQAVVDEFQNVGDGIRDSDKGKWKMIVAPRLGRAGLVAQNDAETDEGSGDMDMRIIVREAQCVLEEPKPLRMLEMKRMILLCREKVSVGGPTCRDRGMRYPMKA